MNSSILQINVTANWGSTGKIAEQIGNLAIREGFESYIAYGRKEAHSNSNLIKVGNNLDHQIHGLQSRIFDRHGLASKNSTKSFIEEIKKIKPDIIHLHNFHGYFINYPILFQYLKEWGGPVVWTLHDCWPFTGHCAYYDFVGCDKWKSQCENCPQLSSYPAAMFIDRSKKNYQDKKEAFLGLPNVTLVPVSNWLAGEVKKSFLKDYPVQVIQNGIDLNVFQPIYSLNKANSSKLILGVASVWDRRKGFDEFIKLRNLLPQEYNITLVGLSPKQIKSLPEGITGMERTENVGQLVELYNKADVFVNPSLEETLGMTTIEALACGTPSIVYKSTAVPEPLDDKTGIIVDCNDVNQLAEKIKYVCQNNPFDSSDCRNRAELLFDKNKSFQSYINLYKKLLEK